MTDVTVTMSDELFERAEAAAARDGKSLSRFIAETMERRVGGDERPTDEALSQAEALERFLSGPPMNLLDANGNAPTRDELIGRPRFR